jgi:AcrR family transcriptional regulator
MVRRGPYAKGVVKREEILDAALRVIARNGYHRTSVRDIAAAVGLSQAGVLHHFASKEALFVEVLRRRDEVDRERMPSLPTARVDGLVDVVRHNADVPGLVQLYAEVSTEASHPEHPGHDFLTQRYAVLRAELAGAVRAAQEREELSSSLDPEVVAAILLATADGLQTQWMLEPRLDMAEHVRHLWDALRRVP